MENREMKKLGLKQTRTSNENLIVQTLLKRAGMSRVELAEETGLSPSTVTSLTAELLRMGIIQETGAKVYTAGRARVELTVNSRLGYFVVLELSHDQAFYTAMNMHLETLVSKRLPGRFMDGNGVLAALSRELQERHDGIPLAGIGVLFQEDVRPGDFSVMYSTGYASANISLMDAMKTQFRVPVLEEFGAAFTLSDALQEVKAEDRNLAHIRVGESIRTIVRIDGSTVPLRDQALENLTTMLPLAPGEQVKVPAVAGQLCALINLLYAMFRLDLVLIAGNQITEPLVRYLRESVDLRFTQGRPPEIVLVEQESRARIAREIGTRVRARTLSGRLETGAVLSL